MATAPIKSPLHNFPFSFLKWGSSSVNSPHHRFRRPAPSPPPDNPPSLNPDKSPTVADSEPDAAAVDQAQRQWNLRPRRSAPSEIAAVSHAKSGELFAEPETAPKSSRLRGLKDGGYGHTSVAEKKEKRKLWVSLSKEEIEDDFYSLTGSKPPRRPRKRPRNVQKQLDSLFPGLWLVGVSPESYRTADAPSKR